MDVQTSSKQKLMKSLIAAIFLVGIPFVALANEMKDIAIYKDWKVTKVVNNINDNVEYRAISRATKSKEAYFLTCQHSFFFGPTNRSKPFQAITTRVDNNKSITHGGFTRGPFVFLGGTKKTMNEQMRAGHPLMLEYQGNFDQHIAVFSLMGYTAATSKLRALCNGKYLANK